MVESVAKIEEIPARLVGNKRILILGGIREAADLAAMLAGRGHFVMTSLAGRTKEPLPVSGDIRIGGFGGATGLSAFIKAEKFDVLIDATHPFARLISANASIAAQTTGCHFISYTRPVWQKQQGDHWIDVASLEEAKTAIPVNSRVLLALGSQHIDGFSSRQDVHFIIRMVDLPQAPLLFENFSLIIGKPGGVIAETQLLKEMQISHILCRNSGGVGAYAKIEAARNLLLPVIIINR